MYTFNELRKFEKNLNKDKLADAKLAILGDCATQHITIAIKGYAVTQGIRLECFEADYNQVFSLIMDTSSELYCFRPQFLLVFLTSEKLYIDFCSRNDEKKKCFADDWLAKIKTYYSKFLSVISFPCAIIQTNFVELNDNIFGNLGAKTECSFIFQIRKLNYLFQEYSSSLSAISILDVSSIQNQIGREHFVDYKMFYLAKMSIAIDAIPSVAKSVTDIIRCKKGKFKKCVVLDLDNTIWGGVIGDDGLSGIKIGELGIGPVFSSFQLWLKQLKERGVVLAVNSKNNEETAKEPFLKHPDMVLRLEDISLFVANWNDKASNIAYIQKVLNIGFDSMVFLDDNAFERNVVRSAYPDVTVPELPDDPTLYLPFLKSLNLFETASYSEEDTRRTEQYRQESNRTELQLMYDDYNEYLSSLEMVGTCNYFDEYSVPRIAQLTQRSNQFNLRTIRYSEDEISSVMNDSEKTGLYFCLRDKIGDYGLISVAILEKENPDTLFISEWLMSCRVLRRGMEEFVMNCIVEKARNTGFSCIDAEYIPTEKNKIVENIYSSLGFTNTGKNKYRLKIDDYIQNRTYIVENKE